MPTNTKENYLKALYTLHQKDPAISLSDLGNEMGVSKPTANDMVKKFEKKGWVVYKKYKPLTLTPEGAKMAALVIRKHRLAEMFLEKIMGFGWEEVHAMAEEIEHLKSEPFFDRMDELLGFPKIDPHGSPIPDKNGNFNQPNYTPLSQIAIGQKVALRALRESSNEFLLFLNKKEIKLGVEITVLQIEAFDKSLTVAYGDFTEMVLSHSVSSRLLVS